MEGGGCAGFQYGFNMEGADADKNEEELIFETEGGCHVVSDAETLEMINGAKIVYKTEMIRSGFEVAANPMAEGGCSCGTSFTPKD